MTETRRRHPLIADDMGSGKTSQAIGTFLLLYEQGYVHKLLIVCPKNVIVNWKREFKKVASEQVVLRFCTFAGVGREKMHFSGYDVVLVTFETLWRDIERFEKIRWGMLIVDEVHQIRNHDTKKSCAVKKLKADYIIGLSGTPIVNSLGDIHSIMELLNPDLLGPKAKFDYEYGDGGAGGYGTKYIEESWAYRQIKEKVDAVMLRRDPEVILKDLPPYHRIERWIDIADTEQGRNYDKLVQSGRLEYENKQGEMSAIETKANILALIMRLKQQCNIDFVTKESAKMDYLEEFFKDEIHLSGDDGNKVVIFSQFKDPLRMMMARFQEYCPLIITGETSADRRQEYADLFNDPNSPHKILVAQIAAAGEGLNLDGGNYAILFDLWWNEAKHQQAFKRIRRMTQKRAQHFMFLLVENTIEDKILQIIDRKSKAFKGVIEGQSEGGGFSIEDLVDSVFNSGLTQ